MRQLFEKKSLPPALFAFGISFLTLLVLFPRLFLGLDYVMGQGIWELQDPAVSSLFFVPSGRMLRHELFSHGWNFLWSNARGFGQPILGNDIQVAPMFPLTLLLRFLPDPYFWQAFVLARLILLGGFSYLFANDILKRSRTGSFVFMICFAFAVHVLRWMNHAWQTAFLSNVLYLYFCSKVVVEYPEIKGRHLLGVVVGAYCVLTSGFPEGSILGGFMALFIVGPLLAVKVYRLKSGWILLVLIACTGTGFLLGSPQLLAIYEMLQTAGHSIDFRSTGKAQFKSLALLWSLITRITEDVPKAETVHFFNLIPLFLAGLGAVTVVKKKSFSWVVVSASFCVFFYVFKNFPLWPAFNEAIGSVPLLSTVWFQIYFLPLLLFPFACLASHGADTLCEAPLPINLKRLALYFALAFGIVCLVIYAVRIEPEASLPRVVRLLIIFAAFVLSLTISPSFLPQRRWVPLVLIAFLLVELTSVRPIHFMKYSDPDYHAQFDHKLPGQLSELLEKRGLSPIELRDRTAGGMFAEVGITSMSNGSNPIVSHRQNVFTQTLFKTWPGWGATMPVTGEKLPYAYRLVSNNLNVIESADPNFGLGDNRQWDLLGRLGTFFVYYDPKALPRAYAATRCYSVEDLDTAIKFVADTSKFELGNVVLENTSPKERAVCERIRGEKASRVPFAFDLGRRVGLKKVRGPGVIVLNDSYYPDWVVTDSLTGSRLSMKPANVNFRGVLLPEEKDYELVFEYEPRWLGRAKTLFSFGWILLFVVLFYSFMKEKVQIRSHFKRLAALSAN